MLVLIGIPALALIVAGIVVWFLFQTPAPAVSKGERKPPSPPLLAAVMALVMADEQFLAYTGVLDQWDSWPPPVMLLIGAVMALTLVLALTGPGKRIARDLPFSALIGYQAFRLPMELLMAQAAEAGIMPEQMSYYGYNFDIVTGVLAIPVAYLAWKDQAPRWMLVGWNVLGFVLLLSIMGIAATSTPTFAAFGSDPEQLNTWITHAPYVWVPTVLAPAALFGHVVTWRKLVGVAEAEVAAKKPKRFKRSKRAS